MASLASLTISVNYAFAGECGVYNVPIAVAFCGQGGSLWKRAFDTVLSTSEHLISVHKVAPNTDLF